jgi:hypothetical protein
MRKVRTMLNKTIVMLFIALTAAWALASCGRNTGAAANVSAARGEHPAGGGSIRVDVYFLPHPPAQAIVRNVEAVLAKFASVTLREYDFLDPRNADRIKAYGLTGHMPVAIFINDEIDFTIDGRNVAFKNFPKGDAFVPTLEGSWTYADLEKVISSE